MVLPMRMMISYHFLSTNDDFVDAAADSYSYYYSYYCSDDDIVWAHVHVHVHGPQSPYDAIEHHYCCCW